MDARYHLSESDEYDSDSQNLLSQEKPARQDSRRVKRYWAFLTVNTFVFLLNIGLLLMMSTVRVATVIEGAPAVQLPHAAWIAPAVHLELQTFDDRFANHGPYRGKPRPELEAAWAVFNTPTDYTVRVPEPGWMNTTPNSIIAKFQDERGGIMATFSYLHNIHCLKTIRQYMLPEYYPETRERFPPSPEAPLHPHMDHCIDMLRQSELCHADMALHTFEWHKDMPFPVDIHHAPHVCANPDKLDRFLKENTVPPFGPILKNPWSGQEPWPFE